MKRPRSAVVVACCLCHIFCSAATAGPPGGKNIFDFGKPATQPVPVAPTPVVPVPVVPTPIATAPIVPATVPVAATQPVVVLQPVPRPAELVDAGKLVDEVFGDDIAKATTADQKSAVIKRIMESAAQETSNMAGKFALLQRAKDLAVEITDLSAAFEAVDAIANSFQVDGPRLKADVLVAITRSSHPDRKQFIAQSESLAEERNRAGDYDLAKQLYDAALVMAHQARDSEAIQSITAKQQQAAELLAEYKKVEKSETALKVNPKDPAANLQVGRFLCFVKGDWASGLPHLVIASDPALADVAKRDLAIPTTNVDELAVGDSWWKASAVETGTAKAAVSARALQWYEQAEPQLTGLTRIRIEKRIEQIGQLQQQSVGPARPWGTELLNSMTGSTGSKDDGVITLRGSDRISTALSYRAPVTFKLLAMTDGTNIRIKYAADQIIFNWELNQNQLRVDGGPANGRHRDGAGKVPANQWVLIVLKLLPDSLSISTDGKERYQTKADFSRVNQPFTIFPSVGSVVKVKSLIVSN